MERAPTERHQRVMDASTNEDLVQQIRSRGDPEGILRLQLMERNIGFIRSQWRVYSAVIDEEELQSIGYLAIDSAVKTYEPGRGLFLQCLSWSLRNELSTAVQEHSCIRLSGTIKRDLRLYSQCIRDFTTQHGKAPSRAEILAETGFTESQLEEVEKAYSARFPASLDAPITADQDGSELTLADTVQDTADVEQECINRTYTEQMTLFLAEILKGLPKDQALFINLKFYQDKTVPEISQSMNKPPAEVRRLQRQAYKTLQKNSKLQSFFDYENCFHSTGITRFRETFTSATERTGIELYEIYYRERKHHED